MLKTGYLTLHDLPYLCRSTILMKNFYSGYSLKNHNSFGINALAGKFFEPTSLSALQDFFRSEYAGEEILLIGEGSNLLFTGDIDHLVIHPAFKGISVIKETKDTVLVKAGAGENWDTFVGQLVDMQLYGAENLSLIPGSVGSAPVQNIGAYGVEAADLIHTVEVYDYANDKNLVLGGTECNFAYRSSIFKQEEGQNYIVTSVTFKLSREKHFTLDYGDLKKRFEQLEERDLKALRSIIIEIRREKLPDPAEYGNAGSFFKNPVIELSSYLDLKKKWPEIPAYTLPGDLVKIPAAWLIQQSGWKGYRDGDAACWHKQPLVLVNYGKASGRDIFSLSERISQSIRENFGIDLEREVRVL